jgi:hypothetical protein
MAITCSHASINLGVQPSSTFRLHPIRFLEIFTQPRGLPLFLPAVHAMGVLCCCRTLLKGGKNEAHLRCTVVTQSELPIQQKFTTASHNQHSVNEVENSLFTSGKRCQTLTKLDTLAIDDSDGEDNQNHIPRRVITTIDAVRTKLKRRILTDKVPDSQPQTLIGDGHQELARRAELKRLRHKRIQEELEAQDGHVDCQLPSNASTSHVSSPFNLVQVCVGPRDTLEFEVSIQNPDASQSPPKACEIPSCDSRKGDITTKQERPEAKITAINSATKEELLVGTKNHEASLPFSKRSLSSISATLNPELQIPSASAQDDTLHCIAHPNNQSANENGQAATDDHSALGVWLIAQGLPHDDSAASSLSQRAAHRHMPLQASLVPTSHKSSRIPCHTYLSSQDSLTRRARITTSNLVNEESEMDIRQCQDAISYHSVHESTVEYQSIPQSHSENIAESYALALAFQQPTDTGSFVYKSRNPSLRASPARSQRNMSRQNYQEELEPPLFNCEFLSHLLLTIGLSLVIVRTSG